jgi:hypothetical protein
MIQLQDWLNQKNKRLKTLSTKDWGGYQLSMRIK